MLPEHMIFGLTGIGLFVIGLRAALVQVAALARILAINVAGTGVFLVFVTLAYRGHDAVPDPVPHALVLTGIVVAVSATALALALVRRLPPARGAGGDD